MTEIWIFLNFETKIYADLHSKIVNNTYMY